MSVYSLGEEEELEIEEEEQKGPDLKLASRRDMYSICQSVGLGSSPFISCAALSRFFPRAYSLLSDL